MKTIKTMLAVAFGVVCLMVLAMIGYDYDQGWTLKRSTFDKIQAGMTLAEVEALLGPGQQTSPRFISPPLQGDELYRWQEWQKDWKPDGLTGPANRWICVGFKRGKVSDKRYFEPSL